MNIAASCIGGLAIIASVLINQQKKRSGLIACKAIADVLWIIHYLFLGAYTGAAVTGVALAREIVFFKCNPRDLRSKIWLGCFLCISIASSILTWTNPFSIFAMLGSLISIVNFWIGIPKLSRILQYPISCCMFIYGLANGSIMVLINEILAILSATVGLMRYDRSRSAKKTTK